MSNGFFREPVTALVRFVRMFVVLGENLSGTPENNTQIGNQKNK